MILKKHKKLMLLVLIPLIIFSIATYQIIQAIAPFDYNVRNWWDFYCRSNLSIGIDSSEQAFYKVTKLAQYKNELSLLVDEIYRFVDSQSDLSQLTSPWIDSIDFIIVDDGLEIHKWNSYDEKIVSFHVSAKEWTTVKNYTGVFPKNFDYGFITMYTEFPECIIFRGDETSPRSLIYTRAGKRPDGLIKTYQTYNDYVRVEKLDNHWYDVCPF